MSGSGDGTVRIWETSPLAQRLASVRAAESMRPSAKAIVDTVFAEEPDPSVAIKRIKTNADLTPVLRQQALNMALRRSVAIRNATSDAEQ